jgi:hypothetical protein
MKRALFLLLLIGLALPPAAAWSAQDATDKKQDQKKDKKDKKSKDKAGADAAEPPSDPKDINREITRMMRDMQFAIEGGSARSLLSLIDSVKFDDYPRFEDMVERLMREDTIRANFRQLMPASLPAAGKAQLMIDAEMEMGRRDAAQQLQRRRQQLTIDFEYTRRGWRITNITPRDYFQPL